MENDMLFGSIIGNVKKAKHIHIPWMMEVIEEKFDDIMSIIDERCVIYGGAVRDVVAGKEILGDIDILVKREDLKSITQIFESCSRWTKANRGLIPDGYERVDTIKNTISYVNTHGNLAQIIVPNTQQSVIKQKLLNKSRRNLPPSISSSKELYAIGPAQPEFTIIMENTDIVCCGLFSDIFGNIYEVVDGAIDDCKNGVIRLNENSVFLNNTRKLAINRVNKLIDRGRVWAYDENIETKIDERIKESKNG
jgi:hypothetical protein